MLTDAPPRKHRAAFLESDRIVDLDLPQDRSLDAIAKSIESAMKADMMAAVRNACADFLTTASSFYKVQNCGVKVLAARPLRVRENWSTELFGDYDPTTMVIRVWMRTAIRERVSSPRALLNTLLHEFCHHLDSARLAMPQSYHTRGFFWRIDHLYHLALATPLAARKPLRWVKRGAVWAIDWNRLRPRARG